MVFCVPKDHFAGNSVYCTIKGRVWLVFWRISYGASVFLLGDIQDQTAQYEWKRLSRRTVSRFLGGGRGLFNYGAHSDTCCSLFEVTGDSLLQAVQVSVYTLRSVFAHDAIANNAIPQTWNDTVFHDMLLCDDCGIMKAAMPTMLSCNFF